MERDGSFTPQNQGAAKCPERLIGQHHILSARPVLGTVAKCAEQNSDFPSGARLDDLVILVTLKFAEKHSIQLRWSKQSTAAPEGRGRQQGAEPQTSLRIPSIYVSVKLLSKALTKHALGHHGIFLTIKITSVGLPLWLSGKDPTCQCRRHRFDPWSGKISQATEQRNPCATTTEPMV